MLPFNDVLPTMWIWFLRVRSRATSRSSSPQIRTHYQPKGRQRARSDHPADTTSPRWRGDRI